jgi:autophagy-related protein 9
MMLSRVFGKGSVYETLDLDGNGGESDSAYRLSDSNHQLNLLRFQDPGQSMVDSHAEAYALQNRAPHAPARHSRLATTSVYRPYENPLPDLNEEDPNDDVPESLLVEGSPEADHRYRQPEQRHRPQYYQPLDATDEHELDRLERGGSPPQRARFEQPSERAAWAGLVDPKERALWKWANVENLDVFLQQVQICPKR